MIAVSPCMTVGMERFVFIRSITDEHLACWWEEDKE